MQWLNNEFYRTAFTPGEQVQIIPNAGDNVFLLRAEIKSFTTVPDGPMRRRAIATDFAKARKADCCSLYVYDKGVEEDYIVEDCVKKGCSWWWTRSQLQEQHLSRASFIGPRSNIKAYGRVDIPHYGVRPAIRLTL